MKRGCNIALKNGAHSIFSRMSVSQLLGFLRRYRRAALCVSSQGGFLSMPVVFSVILPSVAIFTMLTLAVFGVSMKKEKYFSWVGNAMEFAAEASVLGTESSRVVYLEGLAREYFKEALTGMVEGTSSGNTIIPGSDSIPGNVEIENFIAVEPGDPVPGGTAGQYGYVVDLEVPLLKTTLPVVGEQYLVTKMSYYAVAKGIETK